MSDEVHNDPDLSAFLDGELNQDRREQVEKRIAENAGLRQLLQQWTDQGDAIRALPKAQLQHDLSGKIWSEIRHRQAELTSSLANRSSDKRNSSRPVVWLGLAGLAASLWVGFFWFNPNRAPQQLATLSLENAGSNSTDQQGMFGNLKAAQGLATPDDPANLAGAALEAESAIEAGMDLNRKMDTLSAQAQPNPAPETMLEKGIARPPSNERAMRKEARSNEIAADREQFAIDSPLESGEKYDASKLAEPAPGAGVSQTPVSPKALTQNAPGIFGLADDPAQSNVQPPKTEVFAGGGRGGSGPMNSPVPVPSPPLPSFGLPQVYFVEFSSGEQPLAILSEVFSRNGIEIQTSRKPDHSVNQQPNSLNLFTDQSQHGLEAIYVVSTRRQLSLAMTEISDRANISGFEVTAEMLGQMLAPLATGQDSPRSLTMEDLITRSGSDFSKDKLMQGKLLDSDQADLAAPQVAPRSKQAMAQQLRPQERRQRPADSAQSPKESGLPAETRPKDKQTEQDSLDLLFQSKTMELRWDYTTTAKKDSAVIASPNLEQMAEKQQELVQFLLLIRTRDRQE